MAREAEVAARLRVFGVRHHGPGSARGLERALQVWQPDCVLVEGPPDADKLIALVSHEEMRPPVALLVYPPSRPRAAVFYPFTDFSPEWRALKWAVDRGVPAAFMDLPSAYSLRGEDEEAPPHNVELDLLDGPAPDEAGQADGAPASDVHPLEPLARTAGFATAELWWEHFVELRAAPEGSLLEAVGEAIEAVRGARPPRDPHEARREAFMRKTIRQALKDGRERVAVVCGAWHAPALQPERVARGSTADGRTLRGLKRTKVVATWIPWTNSRLALASGYGAGILSPGWYRHVWQGDGPETPRWIAQAARLMRESGLDVAPASVIQATRLAEALAALRDLPRPGVDELNDAMQTVLAGGEAAPMALVREQLTVGDVLGEVPADTPAIPLQRDLARLQRSLRLKPEAKAKTIDLDLRKALHRDKSHLLHRLRALGIQWGERTDDPGQMGTFHELWKLQWQVEMPLQLIEMNVWGNTVEAAASAYLQDRAAKAQEIPEVTRLLDTTILAALPEATEAALAELDARAALAVDLKHLMDALPPLCRVARYGDVRQTPAERVLPVVEAFFERTLIGLPAACASLADEAAEAMVKSIDHVQEGVALLDDESGAAVERRRAWLAVLETLLAGDAVHGLVRGRAARLLFEQGALEALGGLETVAALALSPVVEAAAAAAWMEGLLRGSGLLLIHEDGLWRALDRWLEALPEESFIGILPLLRRSFAEFDRAERRRMGEKLRTFGEARPRPAPIRIAPEAAALDRERAAAVLPTLATILGVGGSNVPALG